MSGSRISAMCLSSPSTSARANVTIDRKSTRLNSSHTVIYTLSLHDALPIYRVVALAHLAAVHVGLEDQRDVPVLAVHLGAGERHDRSEEHTSELQSHSDLHSFPTRRSSDLSCRSARPPRSRPCRARGSARCACPRRPPRRGRTSR